MGNRNTIETSRIGDQETSGRIIPHPVWTVTYPLTLGGTSVTFVFGSWIAAYREACKTRSRADLTFQDVRIDRDGEFWQYSGPLR